MTRIHTRFIVYRLLNTDERHEISAHKEFNKAAMQVERLAKRGQQATVDMVEGPMVKGRVQPEWAEADIYPKR